MIQGSEAGPQSTHHTTAQDNSSQNHLTKGDSDMPDANANADVHYEEPGAHRV